MFIKNKKGTGLIPRILLGLGVAAIALIFAHSINTGFQSSGNQINQSSQGVGQSLSNTAAGF